jgi:hypothetical protein
MSEVEETNTEETKMFDGMPGADAMEAPENIDLNFAEEPAEEIENDELEGQEETSNEPDEQEEEESSEEEADVLEDLPPLAAEAEAEAEAEVEAETQEEPAVKKPMVPKARLDEVLAKQKALQKQLDDMKASQEPAEDAPESYDFDKGELEYQQFVLEGEAEKAAALRQSMRKAEREEIAYEMRKEMGTTVAKNAEVNALATAAKELEAAFPVFDANSESFDQDLTQEVVELRDAFITQNFDAVDALSKAVNFVVKSHDLDGTDTGPALAQPDAANTTKADKKRREVGRKLKAAESQPPEMPGESSNARGEQAVKVDNLSEDEFNALPEATLKRLRGDSF